VGDYEGLTDMDRANPGGFRPFFVYGAAAGDRRSDGCLHQDRLLGLLIALATEGPAPRPALPTGRFSQHPRGRSVVPTARFFQLRLPTPMRESRDPAGDAIRTGQTDDQA
jgi:hypothetical protein